MKVKSKKLDGAGGAIMGVDTPTTKTKGLAQGALEPGHPPEAVGHVVQVLGQTSQFTLQVV